MELIRFAGLAVAVAFVAGAQPNAAVTITHITITRIGGQVYLDGKPVEAEAVLNGDGVVRTEGGRAEIRMRSSSVFLGEGSAIRVIQNRAYNFNRLEMLEGSAVVATGKGAGLVMCEDTVTLSDGGVFRFDLRQGLCRFRVYQGAASVQLASVVTVLTTGKTWN